MPRGPSSHPSWRALAVLCIVAGGLGAGCAATSLRAPPGLQLDSIHVVSIVRDSVVTYGGDGGDGYVPPLYGEDPALWMLSAGAQLLTALLRAGPPKLSRLQHMARARGDFRDRCDARLDSMVVAAPWPRERFFEPSARLGVVSLRKKRHHSATEGLLTIEAWHVLARDLRTLTVHARATLFTGGVQYRYRNEFTFISDFVRAPDPASRLAAWSAADAERLHAVTEWGLEAIAEMIYEDVFLARGAPVSTGKNEKFEYSDPITGLRAKWSGATLIERNHRLMVRRGDGALFSIPMELRAPHKIFSHGDYRFYLTHQREPQPVVFVHHPVGGAQVRLEPSIEIVHSQEGLNDYKIRQILELTRKRQEDIRRAWREVFGMDLDAARVR